MNRRTFNNLILGGVGAHGLSQGRRDTVAQPNILFICSDQQRVDLMEPGGNGLARTPNMARLAARGVCFANAYSANPVCVPARASLMTGVYASDVGSYCNSTPFDGHVPTWCRRLRDSGYRGLATGKLDLQQGVDYGFKEVATTHDHSSNPDITSLFRRPLCYRVDERPLVDGQFTERTHQDDARVRTVIDFLERDARSLKQPWFVFLGLELPHHPFIANSRFRALYPPAGMPLPHLPEGHLEGLHPVLQAQRNFKLLSYPVPDDRIRRARAAYCAMVTELDEYIGFLIDKLEKSEQMENTLVVCTSDHGEMLGDHGLWLKNNLLEGSVKVPLILAGAGLPAGKVISTPVSHLDLVATLLDLGRAPAIPTLRGSSLLPLIFGKRTGPAYVYAEAHSEGICTGLFMIRKGDWKYIHASWFKDQLFNVAEDPGEFHDLAADPEHATTLRDLRGQLYSICDPEKITEQAFLEQEHRLDLMVSQLPAAEFYGRLVKRLGEGQAGVVTNKFYKGFRRVSEI